MANIPPTDEPQVLRAKTSDIHDYSIFREGDIEPTTGKHIKVLIASDPNYLVFLDDEFSHQWVVTEEYEDKDNPYSPFYGEVINKVTELEGISASFPLPLERRKESRILMASAVARMLERQSRETIQWILVKAEKNLKDRMTETARLWYLRSSGATALVAAVIATLLWLFRYPAQNYLGNLTFQLLISSALGGIGALLSILSRSSKIPVNSSAGEIVHYVEGAMRIVIGILAALLLALAIKSNVVLGIINSSGDPFAFLLTACFVAGASERIAPGLIKQVEGMVSDQTTRENKTETGTVGNQIPLSTETTVEVRNTATQDGTTS
jgi:hypothetical protein